METLSKKDQQFCDYAGLAGIGLTVVCFTQELYYMIFNYRHLLIISGFICLLIAFSLLIRRSVYTAVIISISAVWMFGIEAFTILAGLFSLAGVILTAYTIVIVVLFFMEDLPKKFKERRAQIRSEDDYWKDKL